MTWSAAPGSRRPMEPSRESSCGPGAPSWVAAWFQGAVRGAGLDTVGRVALGSVVLICGVCLYPVSPPPFICQLLKFCVAHKGPIRSRPPSSPKWRHGRRAGWSREAAARPELQTHNKQRNKSSMEPARSEQLPRSDRVGGVWNRLRCTNRLPRGTGIYCPYAHAH